MEGPPIKKLKEFLQPYTKEELEDLIIHMCSQAGFEEFRDKWIEKVSTDKKWCKLFVHGLDYSTKKETLEEFYSKFGNVKEAVVLVDKKGQSKGYGFVTFSTADEAVNAAKVDKRKIDGRITHCNLAWVGNPKKWQGGYQGTNTYNNKDNINERRLFVYSLAWKTEDESLRAVFEQYGEIQEAVVIRDKKTGKSKGYGFVTFRFTDAAQAALKHPQKMIDGRKTHCNYACERPGNGSTPPQSHYATPSAATNDPSSPVTSSPGIRNQYTTPGFQPGASMMSNPTPSSFPQSAHTQPRLYQPGPPSGNTFAIMNRQFQGANQQPQTTQAPMNQMNQVQPQHDNNMLSAGMGTIPGGASQSLALPNFAHAHHFPMAGSVTGSTTSGPTFRPSVLPVQTYTGSLAGGGPMNPNNVGPSGSRGIVVGGPNETPSTPPYTSSHYAQPLVSSAHSTGMANHNSALPPFYPTFSTGLHSSSTNNTAGFNLTLQPPNGRPGNGLPNAPNGINNGGGLGVNGGFGSHGGSNPLASSNPLPNQSQTFSYLFNTTGSAAAGPTTTIPTPTGSGFAGPTLQAASSLLQQQSAPSVASDLLVPSPATGGMRAPGPFSATSLMPRTATSGGTASILLAAQAQRGNPNLSLNSFMSSNASALHNSVGGVSGNPAGMLNNTGGPMNNQFISGQAGSVGSSHSSNDAGAKKVHSQRLIAASSLKNRNLDINNLKPTKRNANEPSSPKSQNLSEDEMDKN